MSHYALFGGECALDLQLRALDFAIPPEFWIQAAFCNRDSGLLVGLGLLLEFFEDTLYVLVVCKGFALPLLAGQ